MQIIPKTFFEYLIKKMAQGNRKKEIYLYEVLLRARYLMCNSVEMGDDSDGKCEIPSISIDGVSCNIYLRKLNETVVIHESIHAQDMLFLKTSKTKYLTEGAVQASTLRIYLNDDLQVNQMSNTPYAHLVLLVNQIEKMNGIDSRITIGTNETFDDYFDDFFRRYNTFVNPIVNPFVMMFNKAYMEYNASEINKATRILKKDPSREELADSIKKRVLDFQNRLLKLFVECEMTRIETFEDAKNLLTKLQTIGDTRIVDQKYSYYKHFNPHISSCKYKFVQGNDEFFRECYQKVYDYALKTFDRKDELELYSYEQYMDWKHNAKLLFNLDYGERIIYEYEGKHILRSSIKATDGRVIGKKDEEITQERFEELKEEYLMGRYIYTMREIADMEYYLPQIGYLFIKDGNYYLYKNQMHDSNSLISIDVNMPEHIDRNKAVELIDGFYNSISRETIYKIVSCCIKKVKENVTEVLPLEDGRFLIEQELSNQGTILKKYFICGVDNAIKYDATPTLNEISDGDAKQYLDEYYNKHPERKFSRTAVLIKSFDNQLSLWEMDGNTYLKRDEFIRIDVYGEPRSYEKEKNTIILLTPEDSAEIEKYNDETDIKLKLIEIMNRESLKMPIKEQDNNSGTSDDWIKSARLIISSDTFDIFQFKNEFFYVGKAESNERISDVTYKISEEFADDIMVKEAYKQGIGAEPDGIKEEL